MSESTKPSTGPHKTKDDVNFLHVVIYAGIFLVVGLIVAFLILKGVGRHIVPGKHAPHPTSQLVQPGANDSSTAATRMPELPFISTQQKIRRGV